MSCPVKQAIKEIRGSGIVDDAEWKVAYLRGIGPEHGHYAMYPEEYKPSGHVNLSRVEGGTATPLAMYICDDTAFYITTRKIMLARFELEEGMPEQCEAFIAANLAHLPGRSRQDIAVGLIESILQDHVKTQLMALAALLDQLEQYLLAKIEVAARSGKKFKVSIPNLAFDVEIDAGAAHDLPRLQWTLNSIITYVNNLHLGDLVAGKPPQIAPLEDPPQLSGADMIVARDGGVAELVGEELDILEYVRAVEQYRCRAIGKMNEIYDVCRGLIDGLL